VEFTIEKGRIRFGLSAIKNVGKAAIDGILEGRRAGPFVSFADFLTRVDLSKVNKKTIESLIKTGTLDIFGNRASLLAVLADTLVALHKKKKAASEGQVGLFEQQDQNDDHKVALAHVTDFTRSERLSYEKELLGFYLTEHPLTQYQSVLDASLCKPIGAISDELLGERCSIGGIITQVKKIVTKARSNEMAFIKLEDTTGSIECVIFPKIFSENAARIKNDAVIKITGKIDKKDDRLTILADKIEDITLSTQ
jgi:DNA polymerase-3 subunit alpha